MIYIGELTALTDPERQRHAMRRLNVEFYVALVAVVIAAGGFLL